MVVRSAPFVCLRWSLDASASDARALAERLELCPSDLRVDAAAKATVGCRDDALGADDLRETLDALCDELRVLDEVGRVADHAGNQDEVLGDDVLVLFPDCPLMFVTCVGGLERDLADVRAQDGLEDVLELDIGRVRAVPRAPAEVQADELLGESLDCFVDRIDADLSERKVVLDRGLGVDLVPVLSERGIINLNDQTRIGDCLELFALDLDPCVDVLLLGPCVSGLGESTGS